MAAWEVKWEEALMIMEEMVLLRTREVKVVLVKDRVKMVMATLIKNKQQDKNSELKEQKIYR